MWEGLKSMDLWVFYLFLIVAIIIFSFITFFITKNKSVVQKGILGLQITLLGCVVFILADQNNQFILGFGYILLGVGTIISLTAVLSMKKSEF